MDFIQTPNSFLFPIIPNPNSPHPHSTKPLQPTCFKDRTFANAMNAGIDATKEYYARMAYKDALKTGFFEYQV